MARLDASQRPLAKRLMLAIRAWQGAWGHMPHLFDPMAVATMVKPDLCTWKRGFIKVELSGSETYGYTTFKEDANGPHRVAWDANRDQSMAFWFDRVEKV
jgi:inosine-uridine nucleoside N-ribohydrolase